MNYFALLGIDPKYDIDLSTLHQKYLQLQALYHPDKAIDLLTKNRNLAFTIDLNEAYKVLQNDVTRAEHLLMINNIDINSLQAHHDLTEQELNNVWQTLELIEKTQDMKILQKEYNNCIQQRQQLTLDLTHAFSRAHLQNALNIIIKLKYCMTLINNIQTKIRQCI